MLHYSHLHRQRAVDGFALIAALLLAAPLTAQVDLGLAPMRVEFPAVPGRAFSGTLALSNGPVKTRIRTELLDLYIDETTTPQFVANAPAEAPYSCRSWLSVNPMEMDLDGRTEVPVRFTVRVPPSASQGSFHCAIGFRSLPGEGEAAGPQMRTAVRMIAAIYPIVGKPPISGVIKGLKLEQVADGAAVLWRAVVIMENTGMMLYRPIGDLELVDADGKVVESQKLAPFPVLPKREQRFVSPLKAALAPGNYTLRARIDVGAEIQEASAAVTAESASQPAK